MKSRGDDGSGSWNGSGFGRIFCAAWMNVFVSGCVEWRLDVRQVSWEDIHDGEIEIVVESVEESVVEVVDVACLRMMAGGLYGCGIWESWGTGLESFPPLLGYWIPQWTSSVEVFQD